MILMKLRVLPLLMAATLALTSCQAVSAEPGKLLVVVGLYPDAYLAQAIGGDRVTVINLTRPGGEPHDLELTARQIIAIADSDLTIHHPGLQPALDAAIRQTAASSVLAVPDAINPPNGGDDETGHNLDPHVWLDPVKMISLAKAVEQRLSELDPGNQAAYDAGLKDLQGELEDIDQRYAAGLVDCRHREFITTHAGFSHLAERYNLTQIAIAGISPDAEPSPGRLAEIQRIAVSAGLTTVFFETLASPELARTMAQDLGLTTDMLDPIEGITDQSRADDYPGIMAANLTALRQANGCA